MLIRSFTSPISNSSDTSDVFPQRPPPSFLLIQHPFVVIKRYSSWKEERGEKYRWPPGRGESEMLILDYLSSPVLYAVTIARYRCYQQSSQVSIVTAAPIMNHS
ncbi:hypothetical protein Tco_0057552 [Tanacetum coccineum]